MPIAYALPRGQKTDEKDGKGTIAQTKISGWSKFIPMNRSSLIFLHLFFMLICLFFVIHSIFVFRAVSVSTAVIRFLILRQWIRRDADRSRFATNLTADRRHVDRIRFAWKHVRNP